MADYISREAAIAVAEKYGLGRGSALGLHSGIADCIVSEIERIPAADVEPVRNAAIQQTTIDEYYGTWGMCAECGYEDNTVSAKYCGGCGARLIWRVNNEKMVGTKT